MVTSIKSLLKQKKITPYRVIQKMGVSSVYEQQKWYMRLKGARTLTPDELDKFVVAANSVIAPAKKIEVSDIDFECVRLKLL